MVENSWLTAGRKPWLWSCGVVGRHSHEGQRWSPTACDRFQRSWEESSLQHMEMPFEQMGL